MDRMMKYFIGGTVALLAFYQLAPTVIGFMSDAQTDYSELTNVDNTTEWNNHIATFTNTEAVDGYVQLQGSNTTGSATSNTLNEAADKLEYHVEINESDSSNVTVDVNGSTYELQDGLNEIEFDQSISDYSYTVNIERSSDTVATPRVDSFTSYEGSENEFSSILGLLFILFVVVGVWKSYREGS